MPWFINDVYESSDIAILKIKGSDFCHTVNGTSKKEAMNLMQHMNINEKIGIL